MFAERFNHLIVKYPQEADAFVRLADYFVAIEQKSGEQYKKIKLDPQRLFDIAQAGSQNRLAKVITVLLEEKVFERLLIVESPGGGGIGTFHSYSEIPDVIHDPLLDTTLNVTPDRLRTVYTPLES